VIEEPVEASASKAATHQAVVVGGRERTLHLSESFYRQQSEAESLRLLQARRLVLVLDIDHTLLHATPLSYVSESISSISSLGVPAASAATENQPNSLKYKTRVSASSTAMQEVDPRLQLLMASMHDTYGFTIMDEREVNYIRLRPGVRQFLEKVAPYFDIYIHTKGVREYAEKIMAVLDPDRRLFKSALCRDDVSLDHKSLSHLLPCPSAQVLIVDDTVGVWVPPRGDTSATADIHEHVVWVPRCNFLSKNQFEFSRFCVDVLFRSLPDEYWSFFKSAMVSTEIDPPAMPEADLEPVVATAETASISDASSVTMPSRGRFRIPKRAAPVDPPASSAVVAGSFNSPQAVQTALQSRVPAVSMRRIKQIGGLMDAAEVADNVLHSVSEVLLAAHRLFFDNVDADLLTHPRRTECLPNTRYLLDSMRRSVLSGCVGLFSGVVPRDVDARRVHEYQVSQQLGLSVTGT
jgi:FCP1-like phosphatase family protein